jgi:hypothetical protein
VGAENGHTRLGEAMAQLVQAQAALVQTQMPLLGRMAESERLSTERFARIESDIAAIFRVLGENSRVLAEHRRLLERLPEAVREKIGFKAP